MSSEEQAAGDAPADDTPAAEGSASADAGVDAPVDGSASTDVGGVTVCLSTDTACQEAEAERKQREEMEAKQAE
jgi:hypothetical protein